MKIHKNKIAYLLLGSAIITPVLFFSISVSGHIVKQQEPPMMDTNTIKPGLPKETEDNPNILMGKTATGTETESPNVAGRAVDGDLSTTWTTVQIKPNSATTAPGKGVNSAELEVDLGTAQTISAFKVQFGTSNIRAFAFEYQAADSTDWKEAAKISNAEINQYFVNLKTPIMAKKVRVKFTNWVSAVSNYFNISVSEFGAFAKPLSEPPVEVNPSIAKFRKVSVSSQPASVNHAPSAVDDNKISPDTFWSPYEPTEMVNRSDDRQTDKTNWLDVELSSVSSIKAISTEFTNDKIKKITVEFKDSAGNVISTLVRENTFNQKGLIVNLPTAIENVSYVRLFISDWSGGSIGVKDFGIFKEALDVSDNTTRLIESLSREDIAIENDKVVFKNVPTNFKIDFKGADWEQIVQKNLSINKPLVTKNVVLSFAFENTDTEKPGDIEEVDAFPLEITGLHTQEAEKNKAPKIVPAISEWYSDVDSSDTNASLTLSAIPKIYVLGQTTANENEISKFLDIFRGQYKDLSGVEIPNVEMLAEGATPPEDQVGNFVFDFSKTTIPGYDNETYGMVIDDKNVTTTAVSPIGAYYAVQTILQSLKIQNTDLTQPLKIVRGQIKDYPKFKHRGINLDVAKKPFSLAMLRNIVRELSWYKLNQLQLDLSDNSYFLEDYVTGTSPDIEAGFKAYTAFRLESTTEKDGKKLTSEDFSYTKAQFQEFMKFAKELGVNVVPKISLFGHVLPITKLYNEFANKIFPPTRVAMPGEGESAILTGDAASISETPNRAFLASFDLTKKDEIFPVVQGILNQYIDGQNAIFGSGTGVTINVGGEEFNGQLDATKNAISYNAFMKMIVDYFREKNVPLRITGAFSAVGPVTTEVLTKEDRSSTEFVIFTPKNQEPRLALDQGYKLINGTLTSQSPLVIIPRGRTDNTMLPYSDSLNNQEIYNKWAPEIVSGKLLPVGADNLLGALLTINLDQIDTRANGLTEYDVYTRIQNLLPTFSVKTWGVGSETFADFEMLHNAVGQAPGLNVANETKLFENRKDYFKFDFKGADNLHKLFDKTGGRGFVSELNNATLAEADVTEGTPATTSTRSFLKLEGGDSSAKLPVGVLGFNNSLKFRIKRETAPEGQVDEVIFSAKSEYGNFSIKAKQIGTEKFGYSREGVDFSFEYTLPVDTWVEIELRNTYDSANRFGMVKLFVDGVDKGLAKGAVFRSDGTPVANASNVAVSIDGTENKNGRTFMYPLGFVGSSKNSFKGMITDIVAEPLGENGTEPVARDTEFTRLEMLNLVASNTTIAGINSLTPAVVSVTGIDATKEKVEVTQVIRIPNNLTQAIARVTVTSISDETKKLTKDIIFTITTSLSEVNKLLTDREGVDLSTFSRSSIDLYKAQLQEFKQTLAETTDASEGKITELKTRFSEIVGLLKTFAETIDDRITILEAEIGGANEQTFDAESLATFKTMLSTIKTEIAATPVTTQELNDTYEQRISSARAVLQTNKQKVLEAIEVAENKVNKSLHTTDSITKYEAALNEIKTETEALATVNLEARTKLETRLSGLKLVTFKESLQKTLDAIVTAVGNLNQYTTETKTAYSTALEAVKNAISGPDTLTQQSTTDLIRELQIAQGNLVRQSTETPTPTPPTTTPTPPTTTPTPTPPGGTTDTTTKPEPESGVSAGVIAWIIFGSLSSVVLFSWVIFLMRRKRKGKKTPKK